MQPTCRGGRFRAQQDSNCAIQHICRRPAPSLLSGDAAWRLRGHGFATQGMDPEGRRDSASPSLRGSPTGRAAASSAIIAPDQLARRLGWIDYDLPRIPGLGSRDPGQPGPKLSGPAW